MTTVSNYITTTWQGTVMDPRWWIKEAIHTAWFFTWFSLATRLIYGTWFWTN